MYLYKKNDRLKTRHQGQRRETQREGGRERESYVGVATQSCCIDLHNIIIHSVTIYFFRLLGNYEKIQGLNGALLGVM